MCDKTFEELFEDFKSYSDLTQLQGQIRVLPIIKRNIKALIQWSQSQYFMGIPPEDSPSPIDNVTKLLRDQKIARYICNKIKNDSE